MSRYVPWSFVFFKQYSETTQLDQFFGIKVNILIFLFDLLSVHVPLHTFYSHPFTYNLLFFTQLLKSHHANSQSQGRLTHSSILLKKKTCSSLLFSPISRSHFLICYLFKKKNSIKCGGVYLLDGSDCDEQQIRHFSPQC